MATTTYHLDITEGDKWAGMLAEAVVKYHHGVQVGSSSAFDCECPLLNEWAKNVSTGFAPVVQRKSQKRMDGPYLLPEGDGNEKRALDIKFDAAAMGEVCQQARAILRQHKPQCLQAMLEFERKRTFEHSVATDRYCTAIVQHSGQIGEMPTYLEYIEEVCAKRITVRNEDDETMRGDEQEEDGGGTPAASASDGR